MLLDIMGQGLKRYFDGVEISFMKTMDVDRGKLVEKELVRGETTAFDSK